MHISAPRMDPSFLRHFPEHSTLVVLDAALLAATQGLRAVHPVLDELFLEFHVDVPPTMMVAYLALRRAEELRKLLALYNETCQRALRPPVEDDSAF